MRNINTRFIATSSLLLTCLAFQPAMAQHKSCGTDELHEKMQQDPRYRREIVEQEQRYEQYVASPTHRVSGSVRTIPVVVHFIQSSDIELVPDATVYAQIDVLNEDFRRMTGTPGFGNGVDTDYEFCLASIDPNGCPTTGINRIVAPQWAYHEQADGASMKALSQWNPRKYLNIWVPRTIETSNGTGQVIGYATFPFNLSISPNLDGVVIHSGYFGRAEPTYRGRTTTHEVGHWMGLFHTFQNGCQGASQNTCAAQGDRVCDTPQAAAANFGCPNINSCTDTPTDLFDMIENYMDYSDGSCQNLYTQGQKDRMDFYCNSIRTEIWSPSNVAAAGCDGTTAACAPSADFKASNTTVCVGVPVQFTDMSGLSPTSWNWTFTGGTPATSTQQNPVVTFSAPGSYNVTLVAGNGQGTTSETKFAYVEAVQPTTSGLAQSFEGILSLPQGWSVTDNGGIYTWQLVTNAHSQGQNAMKVKNFEARNSGESMSLHSNAFTLQNMISGYMTFDYSYKKYSGLTTDGLKVYLSTDCGETWEELWSKSGPYLATVAGSTTASEWLPTQASHWLSDTISLDSFAGEPNVKVRFEVTSGAGQSVYLDNINMNLTLVSATDPRQNDWSFQVAPNPFSDDLRIDYALDRSGELTFVLTDISGKVLMQTQAGRQSAGQHSLTVNAEFVQSLPAGVYFLKGTGANSTVTRKLVKVN